MMKRTLPEVKDDERTLLEEMGTLPEVNDDERTLLEEMIYWHSTGPFSECSQPAALNWQHSTGGTQLTTTDNLSL